MKQNELFISSLLAVFLLVLWLGFTFHQDERFAGSFYGGMLAIAGALFLLAPLFYLMIKRVSFIKGAVTKRISFSTLLTIHIYSGFIGAILILLHTGHKFHGILATALTALLLVIVFSGYSGRYLLSQISKEISEKKNLLGALETQFLTRRNQLKPAEASNLAGSISDVEYAISTHNLFKSIFSVWLKLHIVLSLFFYFLLILHVTGGYYYGLRWFE